MFLSKPAQAVKLHHLRFSYEHVCGEKNIAERALLLVDSWAGHKDPETMKLALPSKSVDVLLIPERTAKYVQTLDQGSLNVTAQPAAAGGLASASFKISIYKNQICYCFLPFYHINKIRKFYP
jgi:hypothetical protein